MSGIGTGPLAITDWAQARKAVLAFLAPGAIIIGSAVLPVSDGGSNITWPEVITALVAMIVTGSGVYKTRNAPLPNQPERGL
jgi:hypothetical protein